ncbi:hypothetical protein DFH06DRAFT_1183670 [Mycena polygramma]|nr:hypothetical protein DFH06DRAFT_1183670 [Mycena polygramma]
MHTSRREVGTLIVVILKANHLPNKRNIGKQDPYCVVVFNGEKQRTKVVKRGGQHPEWDEEIRFTLFEDDVGGTANAQDSGPPPLPPKDGKKNVQGGNIMKLSCFADDPREPSLIGQADVDLTEALTKGETDEWFTLMNREKFAGKVYLELTFYSKEPAPEKKAAPVVPQEYSGPGVFTSSDDIRTMPGDGLPYSRVVSTSSVYNHSRRQSDHAQSTVRSSNSLAQLDLYRPAYEQEQRSRVASFNAITNDFGELALEDPGRRRESFPPPPSTIHNGRPQAFSSATYPPPHAYEPSTDAASMYSYERPVTPPGQSAFANPVPYAPQAPYRPQYDSGSTYNPPPSRGPRYSMPTHQPSGFRPLSTSSSFVSHPSEPLGFAPPLSHTPAPPAGYPPSQINPPASYAPVASQTPGPGFAPPLPPSSSASFHSQQGFPPSQSFQYSQFQPQPPPHQYNPSPPNHAQSATPPGTQGYPLPPSPSNQTAVPSLSHSNSLSSSAGPGSRPLPMQPQPQFHTPPGHQPYGLPPSTSQPLHQGTYSPGGSTFQDHYQPPPPPPPQSYLPHEPQGATPPYQTPPPPPGPPSHSNGSSPRRQSSLPPPPTHLQQPSYPSLPPPPPPPLEYSPHNPPPPPPPLPSYITTYYPGPPPRPPAQIDPQAQWSQPPQNNYAHQENGYVHQGWS